MVSSFNLEKLTSLLQDFYTVTRIRITVFDEGFQEIAAWPRERAPICQLIRRNPQACSRCVSCDKLACQRTPMYTPVTPGSWRPSCPCAWEI